MRKNGQIKRILATAFGISLGATALVASPAAAATQIAHNCVGEQVIRCANVEMSSPGVFNAHARVTDTAGGGNYDVMVHELRLEVLRDGIWWTVTEAHTDDAWAPTQDVHRTASWSCGSSPQVRMRAITTMQWADASGVRYGEITSGSVTVCPRA